MFPFPTFQEGLKWIKGASHNFCRNPTNDDDGPWCYTTDPDVKEEFLLSLKFTDLFYRLIYRFKNILFTFFFEENLIKWGRCPVFQCIETENEFLRDQAACGKRPKKPIASRVIGGRSAQLGEIPYQARLRFTNSLNMGTYNSDHQCGGTIISSCWVVTAAHCIPEYRFKRMLRVDVGSRFYYNE